MGVLIHLLEGCCEGYLSASDSYQRCQRKVSNMMELSSDELKEVILPCCNLFDVSDCRCRVRF